MNEFRYKLSTINHKLFCEAKRYIAAGVNSPVRSFKAVGGEPVFVKKAYGAKIFGEDGKNYIDYCLSWGALLLGHTHPEVTAYVKKAIDKGASYGAATKLEIEFAKVISRAVPSMERLRLVSSGTEAAMTALRLAKGHAKKNKIIKFKECYHGHSDYFLAGRSAGISENLSREVISLEYNNLEQVDAAFKKDKDIACVIVEPIAANTGLILPQRGFLEGLRKVTRRYKSLLIFDEVITGFRFCFGGAQNIFKITPDITCLGKIIGGGFPLACLGGKREIMEQLAPSGNVYQAGTLSGNPVAVSAGLKTLELLQRDGFYDGLKQKGIFWYARLAQLMEKSAVKARLNHFGTMFNFGFEDRSNFSKFFHLLLSRGVYLSPAPDEVCFLSSAHNQKDLQHTLRAVDYALQHLN
jgi:glutamate-1-semialdehyde 2,1-aminomutase